MTRTIPGYHILDTIHDGTKSLIYRALRESDRRPVILKLLKDPYPTSAMLARYRQEYELLKHLEAAGVNDVIRAYDLQSQGNGLLLVMEDIRGESLKRFLQTRDLSLEEFLRLAIKMATVLQAIHAHGIIHKDVNPSNIVINTDTGRLQFIDFGLATAISRDHSVQNAPTSLEGTLAYISPEQTGRMNRTVDLRTDFYSLGATFYEMLTGRVPFDSGEAVEVVHSHIAKQPVPPHEIRPDVPRILSRIMLKLMSKNAGDRYQSAEGIRKDLEACLKQWTLNGRIEPFPLAQDDVVRQLTIPEKLYGRELEQRPLHQAFEGARQGFKEMAVISGTAGAGKTALAQELQPRVTKAHGYFISGRYEPSQRSIPYSGIAQAFRELVKLLLTEPPQRLARWKAKLSEAVGENGSLLIEIIPALELILGSQPPAPELGPTETRNRFHGVFRNFVRTLSAREHPLVVFLDNGHVIDAASLTLLQMLMTDPEIRSLLVILAYQSDEIEASHPLLFTLEELKTQQTMLHEIPVKALAPEAIRTFIADALQGEPAEIQPLAEVVAEKTDGNPFFMRQFLCALYDDGIVRYDREKHRWTWDMAAIHATGITENVVTLLTERVQTLPAETQDLLKTAACLGREVSPEILMQVCETDEESLFDGVREAFQNGLLIKQEANFYFAHDRVREAAYSLLDAEERKRRHLRIGRILSAAAREDAQEEHVFIIAQHLNQGRELLSSKQECLHLAQLNLSAGIRARNSAACDAAADFLRYGLDALPPDAWTEQYELALSLFTEGCTVEYLVGRHQEAERHFNEVLSHARRPADKTRVYEAKMNCLETSNKYKDALHIGQEGLRALQWDMPRQGTKGLLLKELLLTKTLLFRRTITTLRHLPALTEPRHLAIARLLMASVAPAHIADPDYFAIVSLKLLRLSIKYGNSMYAAVAYATYGIMSVGALGDRHGGYQFGRLALEMLERFQARSLKPRVFFGFGAFINHWQRPLKEGLEYLLNAYQSGVESGDFSSAGYGLDIYMYYLLAAGTPVPTLKKSWEQYEDGMKRLGQPNALELYKMWQQVFRCLSGETDTLTMLRGERFDETVVIPRWKHENVLTFLGQYIAMKMLLCYLAGEYEEGLAAAKEGRAYLGGVMGMMAVVHYHFYSALTLLARCPAVSASVRRKYFRTIRRCHRKLQRWAQDAPENFEHLVLLVEAESRRVRGAGYEKTIALYEQAIALARQHGFLHDEALANELAGTLWLNQDNEKLAGVYLQEARYAYQRWGAIGKNKALEDAYPHLLSPGSQSPGRTSGTTTTSSSTGISPASTSVNAFSLDLATILKASQAISSEIDLKALLTKLMNIVIENAGARRGCLLLFRDGELLLEAEGSVDRETSVFQALPVSEAGTRLSPEIVHYVARTGEQVVLDNAAEEGHFTRTSYVRTRQLASVLCSPLLNKGTLIGVIYLENTLSPGAFTANRIEVLNILASQAAISIENSKLIEHVGEQERLKREMELAHRIQTALLPDLSRPVHPELDIAAIMLPAEEVGGDFYDVAPDSSGHLWLAIGDVSGHGVTPGLIMMIAQSIHSTLTTQGELSPKDVVIRVNEMLYRNVHERLHADHFMTFTTLKYHGAGHFEFAGLHVDLLIYRTQQKTCELVETTGLWLNLLPDIATDTENASFTLDVGDILILYTDGLTEAQNQEQELFDLQRFMDSICRHAGKSAVVMRDAIMENVLQWCQHQRDDDMSVVLARRIA